MGTEGKNEQEEFTPRVGIFHRHPTWITGINSARAIGILAAFAVLPVDLNNRQCVAHAGQNP